MIWLDTPHGWASPLRAKSCYQTSRLSVRERGISRPHLGIRNKTLFDEPHPPETNRNQRKEPYPQAGSLPTLSHGLKGPPLPQNTTHSLWGKASFADWKNDSLIEPHAVRRRFNEGAGVRIVWRTAHTFAALMWDRLTGWTLPRARRTHRRQALRGRLIDDWTFLLGDLKGAFAKAGQFASLRHDLVPADIAQSLAQLRDQVPPMEFNRVEEVIHAELGAPLDQLFLSIETQSMGAASIAQAHRAKLLDGSEVIIKVQYPWIQASLSRDLMWLRLISRLVLKARLRNHKYVDRSRFFAEFESGLRDELDFEQEAQAAIEISKNLAHDKQVKVPSIIHSHSSKRVLTMQYEPCVNVSDRAGLARLGVSATAILEILARAYAKQVFVDGFFHADPHPGNLFVIDEPEAAQKPCVLFVDFGLHKRLSKSLRQELRQSIYALLQQDLELS